MLRLSRCGIRARWERIGRVVCWELLFDELESTGQARDKIMIQHGYDGVVAEGIEYKGVDGIREIYPYYKS
jgi:hypothetical protein